MDSVDNVALPALDEKVYRNLQAEYGSFLDLLVEAIDNEESLAHYGVKGMRWGIRKERMGQLEGLGPDTVTATTKNGDVITMSQDPANKLDRGLAFLSQKYTDAYNNGANLTIRDKDGNKVGDAAIDKRPDGELYLNWIGIDRSARGQGYASAALKAAEEFGAQQGFKKMTLEVPGNSPDARHIYEKMGFTVVKENIDPNDEVWGGLTTMEYTFKEKAAIQHGNVLVGSLLDQFGGETLEHYGVKGMKWGVRKDKGHEGERVKTKKLAKLDKQWEKENTGQRAWIKHYNAAADKMNNGGIDKINNDPRWKKAADDGVLNDFDHPETQAYHKAHEDAFQQAMVESWAASGSNPSGTKRFVIKEFTDPDTGEKYNDVILEPVKDDVQHAEGDVEQVFRLTKDANGLITKYTPMERELKHYGVKGMRWGVRKDLDASKGGASSGPTAVVINQKKPGKFAKASGGKRHPLTEDAANALAARQVAKKSTTDALSNAELKVAIERMQLEKKFNELQFSSDRRSKGARFVAGFLGQRKKTKYVDMDEEIGEATRKAVKASLAKKVAQAAA